MDYTVVAVPYFSITYFTHSNIKTVNEGLQYVQTKNFSNDIISYFLKFMFSILKCRGIYSIKEYLMRFYSSGRFLVETKHMLFEKFC